MYNRKKKNSSQKLQMGGENPNQVAERAERTEKTVRLEKGEIFRDTQGNLNRVKKNAPSHQSKEGGVELDNVQSVISDSFSQVASGDRKSDVRENVVKFKPEQIDQLASSLGLSVTAKRSLSPTKVFDLLKESKDKLTKKYLNKTDEKPNSQFAETSLQLNFQNAAQIPTDEDLYDAVFGMQEEKKARVPQLFNEGAIIDEAQFGGGYGRSGNLARGGTRAVAQYQQMLRDAGYNIATDGAWGSKTQAAYEDFQRKAKSRIGGETTPVSQIIGFDQGNEFYEKNVDNNLWRAKQYLDKLDWFDKQPPVSPYLENELPASTPSTSTISPTFQRKGNTRTIQTTQTLGITPWETPVIRQYGGSDVSMQGYRYDSPYQNASSLTIDGGNIDMSATPQDLALIPIRNQEIDWMNAQLAQAWDQQPYQLNADQVLEVPLNQIDGVENMQNMQQGGYPRLVNQRQGNSFANLSRTGKPDARGNINGKNVDLYLTTKGTYITKEGQEISWDPSQRKFIRNVIPDGYVDPTGTVQKFLPNQGVQNPTPDVVVQENGKSKPVFQSASGYVDESGKKVPKRKVKSQVQNGKAQIVADNSSVASDLGLSWDSFTPDLSNVSNAPLPLEDQNVLDKNAQTQELLNTPEYRRNNNTAPSVSGSTTNVTQSGSVIPNRKNRFDFSSPELTTATGLALADSYNTIPALRQTARLRAPLQRLIDPTQALTEIAAQNKATMQNVNPNSTVGQAFQAQVDANTSRTIASTLNQVNQQNAQIEYQNALAQANTANQEQQMNLMFDRQYYQDNLSTQEASRQQRMNTIQNWAMNQQRQRAFRNNLALNELIAPYFVGNDLQNIGDRNGKQVVVSGGTGVPASTTTQATQSNPTRRRSSKTAQTTQATTPWETPQMNANTINVLNQMGTTPYVNNSLQANPAYQNLTPQQQQLLIQSIQANLMNR